MNVAPGFAGDESLSDMLHRCVCTDRIRETDDVFSLVFERIDGRAFKFLAGQFVTIRFSWGGQGFSRAFTIASPPTRPERISLTIKAATDGVATRILHDHFGEGCTAEISDAGGGFTFQGRNVEKALFLCAGSGITPLMSMTRTLHDIRREMDIRFIQCARTESDILFERELRMLSQSMPHLRVETVCSQPSDSDCNRRVGRLDKSLLEQLVPDAPERTAYICGPAGFMDAMRGHLLQLGVSSDRIFEEAFGPRMAAASKVPAGDKTVISFERSRVRFEADDDATILSSAEAAGVYIETACQMGVCGTCKIKLISGEVDMNDMGGLSGMEREDGFILACCSRPRGHVAIEL